MTRFVDICAEAEIPNGQHRAFSVDGLDILVFRIGSEFFAIENRCSHRDVPLAGGRQIGCEIICRGHGGRFDIRTGRALGSPAVDPVRRFELRSRASRIELKLPVPV